MLTRRNNSRKILLRRAMSVIVLIFLVFVVIKFSPITLNNIAQNNSVPFSTNVMAVANKPAANIGAPVRLKIPSINVDAAIYYVGLTKYGAMDIKDDPTKVAWYEFGARPGEYGSAVIAGHYGQRNGKRSVFNSLQDLNKGDEVAVTDNLGATTVFIVRETRKFYPNTDATIVFKSIDGRSHLNLVTCDGTWISSKKTYSDRLVVFTDKK